MHHSRMDVPFLDWAERNGYAYYYTSEHGLPGNCLKLHLGVLTAYIHHGKLVRVAANSEGALIDQMMWEFAQLFAMCARHDGYVQQSSCHVGA